MIYIIFILASLIVGLELLSSGCILKTQKKMINRLKGEI